MRGLVRAVLGAMACAMPLLAPAAVVPAADLAERSEAWQRRGFDRPDEALAAIELELARADTPAARRTWLRSQGWVAARGGKLQGTEVSLRALDTLHKAGDALAAADADLVRAALAEQQGQSSQASAFAQTAVDTYTGQCGPQAAPRADCEPVAAWQAWQLLRRQARIRGESQAALTFSSNSLALAQRADDRALLAQSLAWQARAQLDAGNAAAAQRSLQQAQNLPGLAARPDVLVQLAMAQGLAHLARNDRGAAQRECERARGFAKLAASPRLEASVLACLSDIAVGDGRPREALALVEAGLPAVRRHGDVRLERILLHNGALAHIGLGHVAMARQQAERLFELWAAGGSTSDQAMALREVADALAAAGDPRGALDLFHRERKLVAEWMEARRQEAEAALRERYDRVAQQRSIELKARDNAVQAAELDNRALTQRLWAAAAALLGLCAALVGLLLKRVRDTQRALQRSQLQLRQQSERDPLTGLANRRHGQEVLRAATEPAPAGFTGALMLVDVDHFKHINDGHGHAVGDQVLVAVARRLEQAVRDADVVVRWGGEEFLVYAPRVAGAALDELAARLLRSVAGSAIEVAGFGGGVPVTVSIGYAAFPLAGSDAALSWERALNLADMALYSAKSQGRHRSVGIAGLTEAHALASAEADFERAWNEGRVRLTIQPG